MTEKSDKALEEAIKFLKEMDKDKRDEFIEMLNIQYPLYPSDRDPYPRYRPNSCSEEDVKNLFSWVNDLAMKDVWDGEFAASGIAWSMLETLSLIIADANELTVRVHDLQELVGKLSDQ